MKFILLGQHFSGARFSRAARATLAGILLNGSTMAVPITATWNPNENHAAQLEITGELPSPSSSSWGTPHEVLLGGDGARYVFQTYYLDVGAPDSPWMVKDVAFEYVTYYDAGGGFVGSTFEVSLWGKHMVRGSVGGGHDSEDKPSANSLYLYHNNLSGLVSTDPNVAAMLQGKKLTDAVLHTGGVHLDKDRLDIADLNGSGAPGFIGADLKLDIKAIFSHPIGGPDTGSSLLLLFVALAAMHIYRSIDRTKLIIRSLASHSRVKSVQNPSVSSKTGGFIQGAR